MDEMDGPKCYKPWVFTSHGDGSLKRGVGDEYVTSIDCLRYKAMVNKRLSDAKPTRYVARRCY